MSYIITASCKGALN